MSLVFYNTFMFYPILFLQSKFKVSFKILKSVKVLIYFLGYLIKKTNMKHCDEKKKLLAREASCIFLIKKIQKFKENYNNIF
jgi:hypothetical protein